MGSLGRDNLVSTGLLMAGARADIASTINVWLNAWLRSRALDQMWPQLIKRGVSISLPQGVQTLTVGASPGGGASGGIGDQIKQILDPAWIYSTSYSARGECRIRSISGGTVDDDETINNPATNIGIPTRCKVRVAGYQPGTNEPLGPWTLVFSPIPDQSYLCALDYWFIPNDLDTTVGGVDANTRPWYPNDDTMLDYVIALGYRFSQRLDDFAGALQNIQAKVVNDRMKLGTVPGTDDVNDLDEGMFRRSPPANYPRW